jgi:NifU-like protein involved in Fe-S cluster formation
MKEITKKLAACSTVSRGAAHGPSHIPQEGSYDQVYDMRQLSGFSHSVGTCAPKQGACKLTLNVKDGVIAEALVEVIGCSGMTQSAAMAAEILPGKTLLEALNTDLVCDAINVAMREMFLALAYGRTQTAFSGGGLPVGAGMDDLGAGLRSQIGTSYGTVEKGPRYLELTEGYVLSLGLDAQSRIIGYKFVHIGKMMDLIKDGAPAGEALDQTTGIYGRYNEAVTYIDPRRE